MVVKFAHKSIDITYIFIKEIFRLHGIPNKIILDWDAKFTSNFWKALFASFGTN